MKIFIVTFFLLIGLYAKAQQEILLENNWYLTKVSIDSQAFFPPSYDEGIGINYFTQFENENYFYTIGCNSISGDIIDLNDNSFILFDTNITQIECLYQEFDEFDGRYFSIFWDFEGENLFQYEISNSSGILSLVITNPSGNKAFYENQFLDIIDVDIENNFQIYPNPVANKIVFSNLNPSEDLKIKIFDSQGRLIMMMVSNNGNREFDLSSLKSGAYFFTVSNSYNKLLITKKIIKI